MEKQIKELNYIIRKIDEPNDSDTYLGYSDLGSIDTQPVWIIKKVVVSGTVTEFKYARGSWSNRLTLNYE